MPGTAADAVNSAVEGANAPARHAAAITPSNSVDLPSPTRGIWVGVGGSVKVDTAGGDTVTFAGAAAGGVIPVRATRVYATGTTATNLVALY